MVVIAGGLLDSESRCKVRVKIDLKRIASFALSSDVPLVADSGLRESRLRQHRATVLRAALVGALLGY